jgi:hypothetical protein
VTGIAVGVSVSAVVIIGGLVGYCLWKKKNAELPDESKNIPSEDNKFNNIER